MKPLIGLMLGDATGIGPEQCARVLADRRLSDAARLLVVGDARVLALGARDAGVDLEWRSYSSPEEVAESLEEIALIDLRNCDPASLSRGAISADSGRIAGETLAHMIGMALANRIDGISFAPLNKAALNAGGWRFNDEHQLFAHLARHQKFDGVLSMYHDQGQIATKLKGFNRGVTVTAGLHTVFTTPAHGTAFDIVGKGVATTGALEQAVRLCARLAASRKIQPRTAAHAGH